MEIFQSTVTPTGQATQDIETVHKCAASHLSFEYCELCPGRVSSFISKAHCLLIPVQERRVNVTIIRNGVRQKLVLNPNDLAVVPAGTLAAWQWYDAIKIVLVWIEPKVLWQFIEDDMKTIVVGRIIAGNAKFTDSELVRVTHEMKSASDRNEIGTQVILDALSRIFLVTLVRNHSEPQTASQEAIHGRLRVEQFRRVVAFIDTNLAKKIAVSDLADAAGMSVSSFTRGLKDAIGVTPAEYLLRNRLNKAREMIVSADTPLVQIASNCGFADQAHMSRSFKKRYGLPPKVFRLNFRTQLSSESRRNLAM